MHAGLKLDALNAEWDPRNEIPSKRAKTTHTSPEVDESPWLPYIPPQASDDPMNHIRIFTKFGKDEPMFPQLAKPQAPHTTAWDTESTTVWTDGSCTNNGTDSAKAGSGLWYGNDDRRNKAVRMPTSLASNNAGELAAALIAIQDNNRSKETRIVSDSQYTIEAITTHLNRWEDEGFIGTKNKELLRAIAGELRGSDNLLYMRKVKGHSGDEGNEGADALAALGAEAPTPGHVNLTAGTMIEKLGAKLTVQTQSLAGRGIKENKTKPTRQSTIKNIDKIKNVLEELNGWIPTTSAIWTSLQEGSTLSKRPRSFLYLATNDGHKVGAFWRNIPELKDEYMPCHPCGHPVESMEHILTQCSVSGQEHIWGHAKCLWERTGLEWPYISLGLILGVSLIEVKDEEGKLLTGPTRLLKIIISEAAYLIWVTRCHWRIELEQDVHRIPTYNSTATRWYMTMNKRLRYDRILTNKTAYGRKALDPRLVENTWIRVVGSEVELQNLPQNWVTDPGVLVGIGRERRPPGRNR